LIMVCVNSNRGKRKRHAQPSPSRRHNVVVPERQCPPRLGTSCLLCSCCHHACSM
jgi:hypothetical protein